MRIRIKEKGIFTDKRIDSSSQIDDVFVKEDLLNPEKEKINIYFRGNDTSGILNITHEEARRLIDTLNPVLSLRAKRFS